MRAAKVIRNGEKVGTLVQHDKTSYEFTYDDAWYDNPDKPPVSLTMPKSKKEYKSDHLFPFFFNMLSEGVNRKLQARQLKIDEEDYFGLLLEIAQSDTIGAITVRPIEETKQ
ncbi:HipA N-terminal domain-containing protein [Gracilimonas halophila]|uniref:HipA N-terminal domain-containing protein n=1 Tax=Gracilimonas halophila TaxID=1834464 RepID=A0ABW5JM45_9BACT